MYSFLQNYESAEKLTQPLEKINKKIGSASL